MCFLLLIAASSANSALTLVIHTPLLTPGLFAMISLVTWGGWNFILICYSFFFNSLPTTSWVTGSLNISIVSVSLSLSLSLYLSVSLCLSLSLSLSLSFFLSTFLDLHSKYRVTMRGWVFPKQKVPE